MIRIVRRAPFASVLALLMVLLVGVMHPANAESADTKQPPESAPNAPSDEVVQALVVGGTAFALMIAAGTAVLFYTARRRQDDSL
ncbi:hypothetical protein [Saccharomonospora glauca]|jgi:hypothetical protein|uniref:Gram-positive cocci surface proteins LPxTG domain-containing protein n=1 Tax=Saccharomonospora glauca K62 TaxID=928724 RepID=I1D5Y3_9PSEU|nr:hypothetical protein [Saccharomonospora glauca]EIF00358.1 hypothetical protein SacglDRAFT_03497 [Saccharomonospora glauca K62]